MIVTTAVAFFETLASNRPSTLRRLHELPGSAIFVDEAHAALPSHLLPVAWKWINCFADEWNCHWVLASGSLNRFWTIGQIAAAGKRQVPDLVHNTLRSALAQYERDRIRYPWNPSSLTSKELAEWVNSFPGPRLLIVNTVQSAAVIAKTMMQLYGRNRVEHLSTALTARDRARTLARVRQRLGDHSDCDWTLVATSCIEAGVDFSFAVGFRETASLSSLLQASGRVNRNGNTKNALMWSFGLDYADDASLKEHPIIKHAATVLTKEFFEKNRPILPTSVTESIQLELARYGEHQTNLLKDDDSLSFVQVEDAFRVIDNHSVRLLLLIPIGQELVLPSDDVFRVDIAETTLSEVREKFCPGDMILRGPGALLQPGTHVLLIQLAEGFKGHVEISGVLLLKGALPFQRFAFGGEAALAFLLALPLPVLVANHGIPAAVLFILIDGHRVAPPLAQHHIGAHTGISG